MFMLCLKIMNLITAYDKLDKEQKKKSIQISAGQVVPVLLIQAMFWLLKSVWPTKIQCLFEMFEQFT